ncbi:hypothetical protein Tco_1571572 [Tanacetum coccineum]
MLHSDYSTDQLFLSYRDRSPSVPISSPMRRALSIVHFDLSPPPKRIRDSDLVTDLEVSLEDGYVPYIPREVGLGVDIEDSYEPFIKPDIDYEIQEDIDECIAYADAIRARGMEIEMWLRLQPRKRSSLERDTVEVEVDPRVIESEQRLQGHMITGVDLEVTTMTDKGVSEGCVVGAVSQGLHLNGAIFTATENRETDLMTERISALEWDNTRLRGMLDVESQRVDQLQRGLSRAYRELRHMHHFRFYD